MHYIVSMVEAGEWDVFIGIEPVDNNEFESVEDSGDEDLNIFQ